MLKKKLQYKVSFEIFPTFRADLSVNQTYLVKCDWKKGLISEIQLFEASERIRMKENQPEKYTVIAGVSSMTGGKNARFFENQNKDRVIDLTQPRKMKEV